MSQTRDSLIIYIDHHNRWVTARPQITAEREKVKDFLFAFILMIAVYALALSAYTVSEIIVKHASKIYKKLEDNKHANHRV
jgi:hypothetical protein